MLVDGVCVVVRTSNTGISQFVQTPLADRFPRSNIRERVTNRRPTQLQKHLPLGLPLQQDLGHVSSHHLVHITSQGLHLVEAVVEYSRSFCISLSKSVCIRLFSVRRVPAMCGRAVVFGVSVDHSSGRVFLEPGPVLYAQSLSLPISPFGSPFPRSRSPSSFLSSCFRQ